MIYKKTPAEQDHLRLLMTWKLKKIDTEWLFRLGTANHWMWKLRQNMTLRIEIDESKVKTTKENYPKARLKNCVHDCDQSCIRELIKSNVCKTISLVTF